MKPITLQHSNGLAVDPHETVAMFSILAKVAFDPASLTGEDSTVALALLLKAAHTYPQYAEVGQTERNDTRTVRPAISPIRHIKKRR